VKVAVCHDRRARSALALKYGRLKFVEQSVDFLAPDKIGQNGAETAPYVTVLLRE